VKDRVGDRARSRNGFGEWRKWLPAPLFWVWVGRDNDQAKLFSSLQSTLLSHVAMDSILGVGLGWCAIVDHTQRYFLSTLYSFRSRMTATEQHHDRTRATRIGAGR